MLQEPDGLDGFRALLGALPISDRSVRVAAAKRERNLTKPIGALGRLEELAIWYAGWRGLARPEISAPQVVVFAANHGIAAQGVSAFPTDVTEQMVWNFAKGGAAINQLTKVAGARLAVHALDLHLPTEDFTKAPAMTESELLDALRCGWRAVSEPTDLLVLGEMGIGNTASASALANALYGGSAADWTGRGTGIDDAGYSAKIKAVSEGVARHAGHGDGIETLRRLGGREIAAIAGAITAARLLRIPVILDGFICCAAAACLKAVSADALDHTVAGHQSAEHAHGRMLDRLGMKPLLDLGLRLGEGTGAALAIGIVRSAVACHSGMASFAEAGVSEG